MYRGEQGYLQLMKDIMETGIDKKGRNGYTRSLFAQQVRFDLTLGFPAITTKKLAFNAVKGELLWFLKMGENMGGSASDIALQEIMGKDHTIWTDNAESSYWAPKAKFPGDLGRIYGMQWRDWRGPGNHNQHHDQLNNVIMKLKQDPNDRRLVVSAWNPGELDEMALPPCHMLFQFYKSSPDQFQVVKPRLSLHMVQRSCDMFLGVPFNIASYALLLSMVAQVTSMVPHEVVITFNDAHIYHEHFDAVKEQLSRAPYDMPELMLDPDVTDIDNFTMEGISLTDYESHPTIKAKMLV